MIRLDQHGGIARIVIDRSRARNAFDLAGWRSLSDAVARVDSGTRAAILCSADPASFSAGADIAEIAASRMEPGWGARFLTDMRAAIPSIAAIDGGCFGAAVALALAADVRIAGEAARFAVTPAKLGLLYPAIDVQRLIAVVGRGQASRLLLTGDAIDASEAVRIGLIEQLGPNALDAAQAMAERIAANKPGAVIGLKATLRHPDPALHDAAFLDALPGDELRDGLAGFAARKERR
jgi:enoyl-CoA hydratase/carnithine racemase